MVGPGRVSTPPEPRLTMRGIAVIVKQSNVQTNKTPAIFCPYFIDASQKPAYVFLIGTGGYMPELVRLGSIILQIFFNDTGKHRLPHFHVRCPHGRIAVAIDGFDVIAGDPGCCDMKAVRRWAEENRPLLVATWNQCNPQLPVTE